MVNNIITEALEAVREWRNTHQKREQTMKQARQSLATLNNNGGHVISNIGGHAIPSNTWTEPWPTDPFTGRATLCAHLMMRLDPTGKHEGMQLFEFINVHKCRDDMYAVFVVKNGKPLIIEDGDLFPSDTLITQLRLLMG